MFYRITKEGLADILSIEKNPESIYNMGDDNKDNQSIQTTQTSKTINTTKTDANIKLEVTDKTDFVLIDLREEPAFERYRIVEGTDLLKSYKFSSALDS